MSSTPRITNSLSVQDKRAMLASRLRATVSGGRQSPLSFAQQRLWFLDQLEPNSALYNVPAGLHVKGALNVEALQDAFNRLMARHEALRTRFVCPEEEPIQVVGEAVTQSLHTVDLSTLSEAERLEQWDELMRSEIGKPFVLARDYPIRALLLRFSTNEHVLLLTMHHIVSDEWSVKVLVRDLVEFYRATVSGSAPALPTLSIQYRDFALWQRNYLKNGVTEKQLSYWRTNLENAPYTQLLADAHRPVHPTFRGGHVKRLLDTELSAAVRKLAEDQNSTVFMVLLAAFKALIARYTGAQDIVIGSPIAGRTRIETEELVGFFVNTLPLRTRFTLENSFIEVLRNVRISTLGAYAHQDLPFDKIVEAVRPERSLSHLPFTSIMFVLQHDPLEQIETPGLRWEVFEPDGETAKFEVTVVIRQSSHGLEAKVEYNSDLFQSETMERLLGHFETLLKAAVNAPHCSIAELPLLTQEEAKQLDSWNQTTREYPNSHCIHELVEVQAEKSPEATAVVYGDECLTYRELNQKANQLAHMLRSYGVTAGSPVALCVERSLEMVIAMLGILKAGGAYVPLDPGYPRARLVFMMEDIHPPVVLTQQKFLPILPRNGAKVVSLDADWELIARESRQPLVNTTTPSNLAYVMYTSGSTGVPKGVSVTHLGVTRLVLHTNYITFGANDRIAQVSNISFDAATFEIWGALLNGCQLVGITRDVALSPRDFADELRERRITAMFLTSALFSQIASEAPGAFATLDTVIAGGEALDPKWVRSVLLNRPPRRLVNGYGPTENTTFTCCHHIEAVGDNATSVPIGKPISNTTVYILDSRLQPVPVGVPGELYTGGAGVAQGYWNRPELTSEKFVSDPFRPGGKMYRTGDLARWQGDGSIEFLGRIDQQVKLRGFRIELTEIEMALGTHPDVRSCAVAVHGSSPETRRLVAYVVPTGSRAPAQSELRNYLASKLPQFMVPSAYISLQALPLTPNGKVDRRALPIPDQVRPEQDRVYVAPRDNIEQQLSAIWEAVLGVKPIGVRDKFFDLGGHSLLAVRLITRIEKEFGRKLRLATVFQRPTIEQIGEILRNEAAETSGSGSSSLVELQSKGNRPPFFLVHGAGGGMFWGYVNLVRHLGPNQPVHAFRSRGLDGRDELPTIEEMASQYVQDMRVIQPRGPYHLGGYCFGGNVAFEMARQLKEKGETVALLALFNCAPPNSSYSNFKCTPAWWMRFVRNLAYWANYCRQWSPSQRREFLRWKWTVLKHRVQQFLGRGQSAMAVDTANLVDLSSYSSEQRKLWESHINALIRFHPKPYDGVVNLYRSPGHPLWCSFEPDYGWAKLARGVQVTIVPGAHEKILEEPCVKNVAMEVNKTLSGNVSAPDQQPQKTSDMANIKGMALQAALLCAGAHGEALCMEEFALSTGGVSMAVLFHHIAAISGRAKMNSPETGTPEVMPAPPAVPNFDMAPTTTCESGVIPSETIVAMEKLAGQEEVPVALVTLAVVRALFQRYEHEGEISPILVPFGTVDEVDTVVKCQMNRLLIDCGVGSDPTFREVVRALRTRWAFAASDAAAGTTPVVRVWFSSSDGEAPAKSVCDLALQLSQNNGKVEIEVAYSPERFDASSSARAIGNYITLARGCAEQPDRMISELPILSDLERKQLLVDWNSTFRDFGIAGDYIHHFQEAVQRHRNETAVQGEEGALTYGELDERSSQLAHYLKKLGAGPEMLVGVCLPRSFDLVVSLLAIWKTGAAYLPLDPAYPEERLAYMLKDAEAKFLLTVQSLFKLFHDRPEHTICLDRTQTKAVVSSMPRSSIEERGPSDRLAYVIYTSGSTGVPKGVEITHRSLLNHNLAIAEAYALTNEDRVLQFTAISFDISVEEIFPTWLAGARLVLRTEDTIASVGSFLTYTESKGITVLNIPTAYWHELIDVVDRLRLPDSLRLVVIGGEKASDEAFRRWNAAVKGRIELINSYGPTEATVTTTLLRTRPDQVDLTIGRPLANTQVLILDKHLHPVPIGVAGELCIGGQGLARAYLRRPELTAERFVPNPWQDEVPGGKLYRTGDLARFKPDGEIEFLGRLDQQVKIRGFRIELGEIEAALESHPNVKGAVVTARDCADGHKKLVAYVVPRAGHQVRPSELLRHLRQSMPAYMIPAAFLSLPEFPLTPAGKVDRHALPEPEHARPELEQSYVAPQSPLEVAMSKLWAEVLDVDYVGIYDNFFDLGGHSLLAGQLVTRLRDNLRLEISLGQLLSHPTIADLLEAIPAAASAQEFLQTSAFSGQHRELSLTQKRIWFLDRFEPRLSPYNFGFLIQLQGALNVQALERSLHMLYSRHEVLRSVFPAAQEQPSQIILDRVRVELGTVDLSGTPPAEKEFRAWKVAQEETRLSHQAKSPLLKTRLIRLSEQEHWLVMVVNEVGIDRDSTILIVNELIRIYRCRMYGRKPELPPVRTREMEDLMSRRIAETGASDLAYWLSELKGAPALLKLPADNPRPRHRSDEGAIVSYEVPAEVLEKAQAFCLEQGCDMEHVLLAAFATLLAKYTGVEDIVVGTSAAERMRECAVANFSNSIAVRLPCHSGSEFRQFLQTVRAKLLTGRQHGLLPFAEVLQALSPARDTAYTPVFQVAFTYRRESLPAGRLGDLVLKTQSIDANTSKLDLEMLVRVTNTKVHLTLIYSPDLFFKERIERMVAHYLDLLRGALENPAQSLSKVDLLGAEEKQALLSISAGPILPLAQGSTICSLFEASVARNAGREAVICGATRLTYSQLSDRVSAISGALRRSGVDHGALVGIFLSRSCDMIAALLAVLRCGAAYVPLDPAYPRERLSTIAEDANLYCLISETKLRDRLPGKCARVLLVEELQRDGKVLTPNLPLESDLAYVIYTSGSTGRPKGVAIEHKNVTAFIQWAQSVFSADEINGVLASTSICFDLSIFEIFVPLCLGGKVILAENALALAGFQHRDEVVLVNTVPSAIRELLRVHAVPAGVKVINLAGEPLATSVVNQIYSETKVSKVYDLYGPTETTTYSTFTLRKPDFPATIGNALANEEVLILDKWGQLTPMGIPGELHIGGAGVARGYLKQPDLTASRFVVHPFRKGQRLYRTGDLGRWRYDGQLEYMGRMDNQVKVRGFRIELGEVESFLKRFGGVRDAVVLVREDRPGDQRLVAYVERKGNVRVDGDAIRAELRNLLPEYMVPAHFVIMDQIPLTPNGKINRSALPVPVQPETARAGNVILTPLQVQIAEIFAEVTGASKVGPDDDFFSLGGNSLLAVQVISRIRNNLRVELPIWTIFDAPTVSDLSEGLNRGTWTENQHPVLPLRKANRDSALPVSFVQERLWFLDQLSPGNTGYNVPMALAIQGRLDFGALEKAINHIVARHEALRTTLHYDDSASALNQRIHAQMRVNCEIKDFTNPGADWQTAANRDAQLPFDLSVGPLIRATLYRTGETETVLLLVMHHTISDGWSLGVFLNEMEQIYGALASRNEVPDLPPIAIQYVDYAVWQRQSMQGETLRREMDFWRNQLKGAPAAVEFPASQRSVPGGPTGATRTAYLDTETEEALRTLCQGNGCTQFVGLLSALGLTLRQWTGQRDMVLGTVVAGRSRRDIENVIGCFMNFLPIRLKLPGGTVREALSMTRQSVIEAQSHQDCPFEKVVEAVNPERRENRNPLYNVALLLQNFPEQPFKAEGLTVRPVSLSLDTALLDLRIEVEESQGRLRINCEYRVDLFSPEIIDQLLASMMQGIRFIAADPEAHVDQFPILAGLQEQVRSHSGRKPSQKVWVSATFTAEPLQDALSFWGDELGSPIQVEFAPYNQVFQSLLDPTSGANQSGHDLNVVLIRLRDWAKSSGQNPESIKPVVDEFLAALEASARMSQVPFLVAICPASGQSCPFWDEEAARLASSIASLPGVHLLSAEEVQKYYPVGEVFDPSADELGHIPYTAEYFTALATELIRKFHALKRSPLKVIALDCDNTLWCGVCGEDGPDGVRIGPERNALQEFMRKQFDAGMLICLCSKNNEEDVFEVFARRDMPLRREHIVAHKLNWAPKSENLKAMARELNLGLESFIFVDDNPVECAEVEANAQGVVVLRLPEKTDELWQFLEHCWAFDHLKVTAEDKKRAESYRQNAERERLRATSMSLGDFLASLGLQVQILPLSESEIPRASQLTLRTNQFNFTTIRRSETELQALQRTHEVLCVHVKDRFGDYGLVGLMIAGEAGDALEIDTFLLSCRVLGRGVEHKMLAYLGDLARSRGLPQVNASLNRTPKNQPALDFLNSVGAAFISSMEGGYRFAFPAGFAAEVVVNAAPVEVLPSKTDQASSVAFSPTEAPFSHSGDLYCRIARDSQSVSSIHTRLLKSQKSRHWGKSSFVAPITPLQTSLVELWKAVLKVDQVGVTDNFFDVGGHSLLAVRLFAGIEKLTGRKLPLVTLFSADTIEKLALLLGEDKSRDSLLVPIQPHGHKPPLFLVHGAGGDVLWGYANLAKCMPADQPIFGIKSRGQTGHEEFSTIEAMAAAYVEAIRAHQPLGPYYLGGYCFGGNVAYEMARQLQEAGQSVAMLAMMDSAPSNAGYEEMEWWRPSFAVKFSRNLGIWLSDFSRLPLKDQKQFILRKSRSFVRKLSRKVFRRGDPDLVDLEEVIDPGHVSENELHLWQAHLQALVSHKDRPYTGPVLLLRTKGQPLFCSMADDFCWRSLAPALEVVIVPGAHESIFVEPHVQTLAEELQRRLQSAHPIERPAQ